MKIEIVHDIDPINPRKEFDHLGTMLYTSSRYLLGDKCVSASEIEEAVKDPSMITLPVYAYIHSGVVLSTGPFTCPWDSGQCGIIYVSKYKVREDWKVKRISPKLHATILNCLQSEVQEFSDYLAGEVFGYRILDDDGAEVDSCWGFYGHQNAQESAEDALKGLRSFAA
jgi:hypothetical protein